MSKKYPRNMIGYGSKKFKVVWPNNAMITDPEIAKKHRNKMAVLRKLQR